MITEYNTRMFHETENHEKKSRVDELYKLATNDIRYAFNKIEKVRDKVMRLSTNQLFVSKPEDIETVELLSTFNNASLITVLDHFVSYTNDMLKDLKEYQQNRLEKIDEIAETIANQIEKKRQEREDSDDEDRNILAPGRYSTERQMLEELKCELLHMKDDTHISETRDAA